MKVAPRNAEAFCKAPDADVRIVLVFGQDSGLVRERSDRLVRSVVDDPSDPFRMTELSGEEVVANPAALADAARAISMTGGRRAVRVKNATARIERAVTALLGLPTGDTLTVVDRKSVV